MINDSGTCVKGIIDVCCDNSIIRIKPTTSNNPRIETLLQAISYASLARRANIQIDYFSIYNPINGTIYTWDIKEWNCENDVIFFLTDRYY